MNENEKLVVDLANKSARGAMQVALSGLETHHYLIARALGDLALVPRMKLGSPEAEKATKAQSELQAYSVDVKRLQERLLTTLNSLRL